MRSPINKMEQLNPQELELKNLQLQLDELH